MVGVERVLEYTRLDSEKALESDDDHKPPATWPEHGDIQFNNVSFSYSEDIPDILHNINFKVSGGEKVRISVFFLFFC